MSPNIKNTLISFFSFFLIAFSLYIFISLLSYDSSDSGYWYRDSSITVNNLGGPLGAFISDYLFLLPISKKGLNQDKIQKISRSIIFADNPSLRVGTIVH